MATLFKKLFFLISLVLFFFFFQSHAGISDFDVLEFGAVADGKTDNTKAFQSALNKAAENRGIVHVPAGKFRFNGVLEIPRGVSLHGIAEGFNCIYYEDAHVVDLHEWKYAKLVALIIGLVTVSVYVFLWGRS